MQVRQHVWGVGTFIPCIPMALQAGAPLATARRSVSMLWSVTRSGYVSTWATCCGMPTCARDASDALVWLGCFADEKVGAQM